MVRKLKHHEQKLLRKVDFTTYPSTDPTHLAASICRRYRITRPGDYTTYNRLAGSCKKLSHLLSLLPPTTNPASTAFRVHHEALLLDKLHSIGLLSPSGGSKTKLLPSDVQRKLGASSFCRRRIGVVMTRLRMAPDVTAANRFVEQGHVRVGTEVVTDPAFLVTRDVEDWVTWVEGSVVRRGIRKWKGEEDDFVEG